MSPRALYALFMGLALLTALAARRFVPKPADFAALPWWKKSVLEAAAFVGGVLGAKLPFVLAGEEPWLSGAAWLADGKTIVAGMAGAYLLVELTKPALSIRVRTGDTFALPLALAMAVGRCGCFLNGCCAGIPTALPWGVDFGDRQPRHPTQIYEIVFHLGMAAVLWGLIRSGALRQQHLKLYLIAYGACRFALEFIRPEPQWWLGLSVYQWACLALMAPLAIQWFFHARGSPQRPAGEGSRARFSQLAAAPMNLPVRGDPSGGG